MNKDTELTVSSSLNQMYQLALDHAIDIVKEASRDQDPDELIRQIIEKLQNLKAK
jgi:hypothetical protein